MRDWKPYAKNENWSQRLIMAREMFAESRAERTEPSLTATQTVQAPVILAQIQDETIIEQQAENESLEWAAQGERESSEQRADLEQQPFAPAEFDAEGKHI